MKKNDKEPKGRNNTDVVAEIKKEFERHTKILVEQVHQEVKIVAEGHGAIMRKLDEHDKKFVKIESELGAIKSELHVVKTKVNTVESELHTVKMAVMDTNQTVKAIEQKLDNHETRITKIEKRVLL